MRSAQEGDGARRRESYIYLAIEWRNQLQKMKEEKKKKLYLENDRRGQFRPERDKEKGTARSGIYPKTEK